MPETPSQGLPSFPKETAERLVQKLAQQAQVIIKTDPDPLPVAFLLAQLLGEPRFPGRPVWVLAADALAKLKIWRFLTNLLAAADNKIPVFANITPALLWRLQLGPPTLLLLTNEDMNNTLPAPAIFAKHIIRLQTGQALKKSDLVQKLARAGYSLERTASASGQIASRGGLLDVCSFDATGQESALRIDFDDNRIDSIKKFIPGQPETKTIKEAIVIPHSLALLPTAAAISAYLKNAAALKLEILPEQYDEQVIFRPGDINRLKKFITPPAAGPKRTKIDFSFIKRLKSGDFVVHADHGIGRFVGITEQAINGETREYFVLEYAGSDKLFLPVTLAEKMEKYIGEAEPTLNRLSSPLWRKTVNKVRADTLKEARELLVTQARRQLSSAPAIARDLKLEKTLAGSFAYEETPDQEKTINEVYDDLARTAPMDRLVCGDVGFGKTEVAIRAALKVALAGHQTALLSPTTILAQQHLDTFAARLEKFPVTIASLSRFQSAKEQNKIIADLAAGKIDILIGTHRLLSKDVIFKNLGLIIIDEEQRFGVEHKEKLKRLRGSAHVLTLSATPIPRTLHLAVSGVRALSTIVTPPQGRRPITTGIEPYNHTKLKQALERELARSGQTYYLYNDIASIGVKKRELENLLPKARFGILHGQLPENEMARVMHQFDQGGLDVLVCSTIIENGLDLPNVNTLIVDNAVRFGLAQLYQIRGRIGRGGRQAFAYFFYQRQKLTGEAGKRLAALEQASELGTGLELAQMDMEIRGVGNVLGKRQHGHAAAVGLGMYLRMLAQSVDELQSGEETVEWSDITVDLPIEARIPTFFESDGQKRIELYHRWALISDLDELAAAREKLARDGALPVAVANLFYILRLKILGRRAGLTEINTTIVPPGHGETYVILKPNEPIRPELYARLLDIAPSWEYATDEIKIKKKDLGENWLKKLEECVRLLSGKENGKQ